MRTAVEVGERVVGLTALLMRLDIEAGADRAELERWLAGERIVPLLSPNELAIVREDELDDMLVFDTQWRLQAIVVLLWALGHLDAMPPYHRPVSFAQVEAWLPLGTSIAPLRGSSHLRPDDELVAERERAELWHWRVRTELLRLQGMIPPGGDSFESVIARTAASAQQRGLVEVCEGDFNCGGVAFGALGGEELGASCSTIIERHYALNWLTGSDAWDNVRTDT